LRQRDRADACHSNHYCQRWVFHMQVIVFK
jgi:hypothetical protein